MKKRKLFSCMGRKKKALLIMKITAFILMVSVMQVSASVYSQSAKLNINMKEASIAEVLKEIQSQTDFEFFYTHEEINKGNKLNLKFENASIREVLDQCFLESGLGYEIIDNVIIITPPIEKEIINSIIMEEVEIKGKVTDADGNPLVGTTILEEGTMNGVTADANGKYKLTVAKSNSKLKFSFIGFKTQIVPIQNKTVINVVLEESATSLDEVVVTGYMDIPAVRSTGSVAKVSSADIKVSGAISIDQVLRGKLSGVTTLNLSGRPGANAQIRIRGLNSITGNMDPIWVVDGMEMQGSVPNISVGGVNLQNSIFTNGIGSIAPEDIESITVLKDAAASALYGARAANGVIVVKTRKGTAGDNRISVSSSFSISEAPTSHLDIMNTEEKIAYERTLFEDFGSFSLEGRVFRILQKENAGLYTHEQAESLISDYAKVNTDWFGLAYRAATSRRHSIRLSGGTQKMQYYASANLSNEKGILKRNELNSFNSNLKITVVPIPRLKIDAQMRMSIRKDMMPNPVQNTFQYVTYANPYEKPYNEDGSYAYDRSYNYYKDNQTGDYQYNFNFLEDLEQTTKKTKNNSITFDGRIRYDVTKNLNVETQLQYTTSNAYGREWAEPGSYASEMRNILRRSGAYDLPESENKGYLRETHGDSEEFAWKNLVKYSLSLNDKHFINLLAGQELTKKDRGNFFNLLPEFDPEFMTGSYPTNPPDVITFSKYKFEYLGNSGVDAERAASFFFNGSYSYKDIYVFGGSVRFDGVDIIGNQNNYTPLWNISCKWNIHRERFMENVDFVEIFSLRGSLGYTGSIDRNALPFTYLSFGSMNYYDGSLMPTTINWKNPNVKWQKKLDRNLGLNLSLFKSRLNVEFNYYNNKIVDLLGSRQLPISSGEQSIKANVASVKNTGYELNINAVILNKQDWRWTVSFNISNNKNKIIETLYQGIEDLPVIDKNRPAYQSKYYTVGYDVSAIFGYEFAGVDPETGNTLAYVNNEEFLNPWEVHSEKNGRKVLDMDRFFNHKAAVTYLGKTQPSMSGGFGTSLTYKALSLSAQFTYVSGNIIRTPATNYIYDGSKNVLRNMANRWRQPGDITDVPELRTGSQSYAYYDYLYDVDMEKGDFVKLSYINLSYNLPRKLIRKLGMQRCRFSLIANNLFTWTNYKGIDPENNGTFAYPSARRYMASLEITF